MTDHYRLRAQQARERALLCLEPRHRDQFRRIAAIYDHFAAALDAAGIA
jgi:hypothetical protein